MPAPPVWHAGVSGPLPCRPRERQGHGGVCSRRLAPWRVPGEPVRQGRFQCRPGAGRRLDDAGVGQSGGYAVDVVEGGSADAPGWYARGRDTALTVASMIPAALFWVMVLAGS
jgi:hypothetical protein